MVRAIMHGCNGAMGQVISGIAAKDEEISIVAGIDMRTEQKNDYPVFASLNECKVEADVVIDFSNAAAVDELLDWCAEKKMPVVLCTTGLSEVQLAKVEETAEKTAVLRSANMSLGINMLLKLLKEAAQIYTKRHICRFWLRLDLILRFWRNTTIRRWMLRAVRRLRWQIRSTRRWAIHTITNTIVPLHVRNVMRRRLVFRRSAAAQS